METLAHFLLKWRRTAQSACVSVAGKAEKETCYGRTFASWLERWKTLAIFFVEVRTHRLKARVSAAEMAEEETCYGGTFASWLEEVYSLAGSVGVKFGRTAQRQVSLLQGCLRKRGVAVRLLNRGSQFFFC